MARWLWNSVVLCGWMPFSVGGLRLAVEELGKWRGGGDSWLSFVLINQLESRCIFSGCSTNKIVGDKSMMEQLQNAGQILKGHYFSAACQWRKLCERSGSVAHQWSAIWIVALYSAVMPTWCKSSSLPYTHANMFLVWKACRRAVQE